MTRDSLAKALYCRTVATIVRRANSLKRLGSTLGTLSSDSNESVHNQAEVTSQHASTIGSSAGTSSIDFRSLDYRSFVGRAPVVPKARVNARAILTFSCPFSFFVASALYSILCSFLWILIDCAWTYFVVYM